MSETELIEALENIIDIENELRREIDRLSSIIRGKSLEGTSDSGDEALQEDIVSSVSINDIELLEVDDVILSAWELQQREQGRRTYDFTEAVSVPSERLDLGSLVDRFNARKEFNYLVKDVKPVEGMTYVDSKEDEEVFELENMILSDEELAAREEKRRQINFMTEFEADGFIELDDEPLTEEELRQRDIARNEIDFTFNVAVEEDLLSEEELIRRAIRREEMKDSLNPGLEVSDIILSQEELEKRAQEREVLAGFFTRTPEPAA